MNLTYWGCLLSVYPLELNGAMVSAFHRGSVSASQHASVREEEEMEEDERRQNKPGMDSVKAKAVKRVRVLEWFNDQAKSRVG